MPPLIPGTAVGPAIVGDKMVGVAYSHLRDAQNIGYIIPNEVVDRFLKNVAAGISTTGHPALYDEFQVLENPALRAYLKVDKSVTGIVVARPFDSSPSYPLKSMDIITKIGDAPVDDQGMVKLTDKLNVRFNYLIQKIAKDGKVPVTILRDGVTQEVQVPVLMSRPGLEPPLGNKYPSYFIYGPLVFSAASSNYLVNLIATDAGKKAVNGFIYRRSALMDRMADNVAFPGQQLVVISSPLFPHRIAQGYMNPISWTVKSINGIPVKNLLHLVQLLHDSTDEFIRIEYNEKDSEVMVFRRAEIMAATNEILTDNGIRNQGSDDVMAVWNVAPTAGNPNTDAAQTDVSIPPIPPAPSPGQN